MTEFIFTWGQRESLLNGMSQQLAHAEEIYEDIGFRKKTNNHLQFWKGGHSHNFINRSDIQQWQEESKQHADPTFVKRVFETTKETRAHFHRCMEEIRAADFKKLPKEEVLRLFRNYYDAVKRIRRLFEFSTPAGTHWVEQEIKQLLRATLSNPEKEEAYLLTLLTTTQPDVTQREHIDWHHLLERKNKVTNDELLAHARTYPSFFYNTYDLDFVVSYLREKLKNDVPETVKKDVETIKKNHEMAKKKQEEIYRECTAVQDKLRYYAFILQNHAVDRFELKNCWSGAEFLALNMFEYFAECAGCSVDEFVGAYHSEDIEKLIDKNEKLSPEEIAGRKNDFVCHLFNNAITIKTSDDAAPHIAHLLGKESIKTSLPGLGVSKGNVTGRARIVRVSNLQDFIKDLDIFKQGDILVTTMTSPNMVVLMKKASAIVTDEGGICSHAAVVSRELGIPCVVGTKNATRSIQTGDTISLNGTTGDVRIIERVSYTHKLGEQGK